MPKVLYISIDETGSDKLAGVLDEREFSVCTVATPAEAVPAFSSEQPDLVLMTCSRLGDQVRRLCSGLRQMSPVPIIVCSATARESDIVAIYEAGADDCLMTPIRPVELVARLRAVLRRSAESPRGGMPETLRAGDLEIHTKERRALRRGCVVDLSPIEFRLLTVLVQEVGRAVSHSRLIATVWGPEYVECRNYLRLYIKYLRTKLEDNPTDPKLIISEWGVGYRLEPAQSPSAAAIQPVVQPAFLTDF